MTIEECYAAMHADFKEVKGRLRTDERVLKFVLKLLDDKSYPLLMDSMEKQEMEEAFRAVHTLKGVCQNLSLTPLYESSSVLCERLRNCDHYEADIEPLIKKVKEDYLWMIACIRQLQIDCEK